MPDLTVRSELDFIIKKLGPYFGVISKSAFMNFLVSGDEASSDWSTGDTSEPDPIGNVANVILDMQEGGLRAIDIVDQVAETSWGDNEELLTKTFRITFEKEGVDNASKCKVMNGTTAGAKMDDQGWPKKDVYSMAETLGLKAGGKEQVNAKPTDGDKDESPNLSVIQIFPTRLNPANRDTGALSIFLNALPTTEISRAVPFIDIIAITKTPMLQMAEDGGSGRITQMSLGQFLIGNDNVSGPSQTMMNAVDATVAAEIKEDEAQAGDTDAVPSPIATVGMEMFTAPQTLINANELHYEFDTIEQAETNQLTGEKLGDNDPHPGGRRSAPVIDRFRPFMSLSSFNVNVSPTMGMMSYKTAEMELVLHDRSRLSEIAPFVKPDSFNRTHFLIEYGWAHPDCKAHRFQVLDGASGNEHLMSPNTSLFGAFIGNLRCKEKYKVVNSSFSFDEVGQVTISVKLAMLPGGDQHQCKIGQGGDVEEQTKAIDKLTEAISEIRKKIGKNMGGAGDVGGDGDVLGVANSTQGAMNIKKEDLAKVRAFIKKNRGKKSVEEIESLEDSLQGLYGKDGSGKTGAVADLKKTVAAEVKRKITLVKSTKTPDPWAVDINAYTTKITKKSAKYVSLGKVVSIFLGLPIAQTGKYDDIQLYFYSFNEHASFVRDYNIAQFPIPVKDFEMMIKDALKLEANMSVGKFMGWLNKTFIKDQGTPAYGMTKIYGARDKEDKHKRKVAKKFEKDSTAMYNEKQKILTKAYGEGENLSFKMPSLTFKQECVPSANKTKAADGTDKPGGSDTILRIHIYDKQATSYSALNQMLQAAKKSQVGLITKSAGNVKKDKGAHPEHSADFVAQINKALVEGLLETVPVTAGAKVGGVSVEDLQGKVRFRLAGGFPAVKSFLMRSMPSARYGESNSGILTADIQSMENPALATINMQRQGMGGGDQPQGNRDAGVPMRVHPVDCSIETIGCPLWDFGQQIFIDFGTGTTVDNIYAVVGIDHTIASGEFKSSVKMRQLSAWGAYSSMIDRIADAMTVMGDAKKKDE